MRAITLAACLAVLLAACQSTATQATYTPADSGRADSESAEAQPAPEPEPEPAPEPKPEPEPAPEAAAPQETAEATSPDEPAEAPEAEEPELGFGEGPLRIAITAMAERRFVAMPGEELPLPDPDFRMQVRVMGADMLKIKQIGNLILTEVVDSAGESMIDDTLYTDMELNQLRRMPLPAERLRETGLVLTTKARASSRSATDIDVMKGHVRAILAEGEAQPITILNPLQYQGGTVESQQLADAGIEVELVELERVAQPLRGGVVLHFLSNGEHVESVKFYDSWMREIRAQERAVELTGGESAFAYILNAATLDNEMQMVINYWPEIDDRMIRLDKQDVPLP